MKSAIVLLLRGVAGTLRNYYHTPDRETAAVIAALDAWLERHGR